MRVPENGTRILYTSIQLIAFVVVVKAVTALRTELRRICRVVGLPTALVALIYCRLRLWFAAILTELSRIFRSARTGPTACRLRLWCAAIRTEPSDIAAVTARASPALFC